MSINHIQLNKIEKELQKYADKKLLIVTKNQPQEIILELINMGYKKFGENKVQEAVKKFQDIENPNIEVHLIGPLQTNKAKTALKFFHTIQTIDRTKLVHEILKYNKEGFVKTKSYYLQVNIGKESQKSGIHPDELIDLHRLCYENDLKIDGLMCIPPASQEPDIFFKQMNELRNTLNPSMKLSMGMSNDYQKALTYNSDIVRIGSLIFS